MFTRRILIVEDEHILRDLLVEACSNRGFEARGAASFARAQQVFGEMDPDLVILDIDLGAGPSGFDFGRLLERDHPEIPRLYLTRFVDLRIAGYQDEPTGRVGYLHKRALESLDVLIEAIQEMFKDGVEPRRDDRQSDRPLASLSGAQIDVLRLASSGLSNGSIALYRSTSEKAIEGLWTGIYRVFGLDRAEGVNLRTAALIKYAEAGGPPPRSLVKR